MYGEKKILFHPSRDYWPRRAQHFLIIPSLVFFFVFIKPNKLIKAAFNTNITLYSNRTLGVKMSNEDTRPLSGALTAIRQSGPGED
jgi:hypothetical protein